jgi:hypothetical protein
MATVWWVKFNEKFLTKEVVERLLNESLRPAYIESISWLLGIDKIIDRNKEELTEYASNERLIEVEKNIKELETQKDNVISNKGDLEDKISKIIKIAEKLND